MSRQQAVDLWRRARRLFDIPTSQANEQARELLEEAIAADESFGSAHGHLSYVFIRNRLYGWGNDGDADLAKAQELVDRALLKEPSDYDNHWSKAILLLHQDKVDDAIEAYREVEDRIPKDNEVYPVFLAGSAEAYIRQGQTKQAIERVGRAIQLSMGEVPDWFYWNLGYAILMDGNPGKAKEMLKKVKEQVGPVLVDMAVAVALADLPNPGFAAGIDDFAEAKALVQDAMKLDDRITLAGMELQAFPGLEQRQRYLNTLKRLGLK